MSIHKILELIKSDNGEAEDTQWLPMSDLMSGLMFLFLLIVISLIMQVQQTTAQHQDVKNEIYRALMTEFEKDLQSMGASIDEKTLTVEFHSPDILFETGQSVLKPNYQKVLDGFFPRYMTVVSKYKDSIQEIRIEGHTSSEWTHGVNEDVAYFENMRLSQDRTRAVLNHVYHISSVGEYRPWIKENLAAVGLSSAKAIKDGGGVENKEASKRVTFRIISNADEQLEKLTKELS